YFRHQSAIGLSPYRRASAGAFLLAHCSRGESSDLHRMQANGSCPRAVCNGKENRSHRQSIRQDKETKSMQLRHAMKWWSSLAVLVCIALSTGPALAQGQGLAGVGPTNPNNGYPTWYQDRKGLALEPCLVFPTDPNAPVPDPCGLVGTLPDDTSPVVFPTNFPDEFFHARAVATIKSVGAGGVGKATVLHALEGAFGGATGTVADGDGFQIVFARLRIRVTAGLTPGATYKVTHPYGVNTFTASDTGTINFTENLGCGAVPPACNFANVLTSSNIGPLLQWDPAESPPPARFIGDPPV